MPLPTLTRPEMPFCKRAVCVSADFKQNYLTWFTCPAWLQERRPLGKPDVHKATCWCICTKRTGHPVTALHPCAGIGLTFSFHAASRPRLSAAPVWASFPEGALLECQTSPGNLPSPPYSFFLSLPFSLSPPATPVTPTMRFSGKTNKLVWKSSLIGVMRLLSWIIWTNSEVIMHFCISKTFTGLFYAICPFLPAHWTVAPGAHLFLLLSQ